MSTIESPDELYRLLARAGEAQQLSDGAVIFERGEHGTSMYLLATGKVVLKLGADVLETVEAPGLFGEMALIDYEPRALTAVTQGDVEVVEIPERRFWVLVHETPRFAQLVMRVMADRLRRVSGTL
ncbi:MAG TPA: cyclic nucleotide-binding domain-containing protein [Solirubrobacteraceae bacterium]|jgi:CRP-like cAMP-binding protein|nr:cyclic nucleotide-binding domain-containing protein [Solirubrobacteraceae bacterium]